MRAVLLPLFALALVAVSGCDSTTTTEPTPTGPPIEITYSFSVVGALSEATLTYKDSTGALVSQTDIREFLPERVVTIPAGTTGEYFIDLDGTLELGGSIQVGVSARQDGEVIGAESDRALEEGREVDLQARAGILLF